KPPEPVPIPATSTSAALRPAAESVGTLANAAETPSWPKALVPQQYTASCVVMPQLCPERALSHVNVCPPLTALGDDASPVLPDPSRCPSMPQHHAFRLVSTAQVNCSPTVMAANVCPPVTACGVFRNTLPYEICPPMPSCP